LLLSLFLVILVAADPNLPADLLKAGLLALQRGKIAEARADLEQASRAVPNNAYVWSALAQTYLKANEPKLASAAAEKAEKIGGRDPIVEHALAMYYAEVGEIQHAARLDPQIAFQTTKSLLERGDFTQAADVAQAGLSTHPDDPQLVLALGVARYGQRRFDDAIRAFMKVIQIDSTIEQPYLFLGKILDQAGPHLQEITKDYEAWAERDPRSAKAHLLVAKALLAADSLDERAQALLEKSIALDSNDWEAHYQLGVLLEGKRDYAGAAKEFERSIELAAKQPEPHYHLARVYDRLGQPDRAQAEREMHRQLTAGTQP
jgi:tetratricopeptide (TPR) repeat protein